jgi:succinoglycan biosynthesis protein ExoO
MELIDESVTYVIPCFNSEASVVIAIESALNQSSVSTHVIVVDDCSTDNTKVVLIERYGENERVKLIFSEKNRGPSESRNMALRNVASEWVAVLDADDWIAPGRTKELILYAEKHDADVVCDTFYLVEKYGDQPFAHRVAPILKGVSYIYIDASLVIKNGLGVLKPVFKKSLLNKGNALEYDIRYRIGEDLLFLTQILNRSRVGILLNYGGYFKQDTPGSLTNLSTYGTLRSMQDVFLELSKIFMHDTVVLDSIRARESVVRDAMAWSLLKIAPLDKTKISEIWPSIRHLILRRVRFSQRTLK